jgi:peroxiredoxin Q/BCP
MALIEPGRKAPAFALPDQHGTIHTLSDYQGRPVILFFYPKDDTSGCTKEACGFRDALPDFSKVDATVFGVSILDTKSKAKFAAKYDLTFPLLADEDHAVCETYGVWQEKSMYGRKYMGIARVTYLIDRTGTVARRWDAVKVEDHAAEVLTAVNELEGK